MSTAKHTPGEWEAWRAPSGEWTVRTVYMDEQGRRCTAWPAICNAGAQDNEANARLIAAAPEMYEALKLVEEHYGEDSDVFYAVRAALAKAESRS